MDRTSDQFVTLLTASQPSLYACIFALLPERAAARDILLCAARGRQASSLSGHAGVSPSSVTEAGIASAGWKPACLVRREA